MKMYEWFLKWLKRSGASTVLVALVTVGVGVWVRMGISAEIKAEIQTLRTNDLAHMEVMMWENTLWDDLERKRDRHVVDMHYQSYRAAVQKCEPPMTPSHLLCDAVEKYLVS